MSDPEHLAESLVMEARNQLAANLRTIEHCVGQLTDEQLWWRPFEPQNSIANLILHLCGNIGQWLVAGVGCSQDTRDRQSEFLSRDSAGKRELLERLTAVLSDADAVLARLTAADLLDHRTIQGRQFTVLRAIFTSLPHFTGHTHQIIYMTRDQLRERYQFQGMPPYERPSAS